MVILTLIISMGITFFLVSKKLNIGFSLTIGALVLALLNGKNIIYFMEVLLRTLSESATIILTVTILLITILGHLMEKYLLLDRMIEALEKMLKSAKNTILIAPAIIGTLLVTGGALMSCPVVENLGEKIHISKDKRAAINLIFRHALYFVYPLSPTMILAAELGNYNIWDFIKLQFPISLAMYVFGYFFYLRNAVEPSIEKIEAKQYLRTIMEFLLYASPILISLLGVVLFHLPFHFSLVLGILLSIIINIYDQKKDQKYKLNENIFQTIYKGIKPSMMIAVIGIMIFKNVVNDIDEIYVQLNRLLDQGIPLELLILIAAAMISFPLSSVQPGVAILYPMILPLAANYDMKLLYAMFIYTNAFIFYYISPLHLCQVLTLEFFEVKLKDLYKNYILILPLTYATMLIIYMVHLYL
ncbi:DUF401 family protein [Clostridiaceae bacterium 35-E11]